MTYRAQVWNGERWVDGVLSATRIATGTTVTVNHDQGMEQGTVIGSNNALAGEAQMYTVRFSDGTISTWNSHKVIDLGFQPDEAITTDEERAAQLVPCSECGVRGPWRRQPCWDCRVARAARAAITAARAERIRLDLLLGERLRTVGIEPATDADFEDL